MMSVDEFDPSHLLEPIRGDLPCGVNMEFAPEYDAIRLGRKSSDSRLPAGMWERDIRKVDWPELQRQCQQLLTLRSKDLQVAAWLVEALVQRFGMDGLVRGFAFFATFTEVFWESVHPQLEEGDASLRMKPVNWLLRECMGWLTGGQLSVAESTENVDTAQRHEEFVCVERDLARLDHWLAAKAPECSPNFEELRKTLLQHRMSLARRITTVGESVEDQLAGFSGGMTRESAYAQLDAIARFLNRAEPHSPVPMVLLGLVAWRNASFADLLQRLPQSGPSVYELLKLFSVSPTDS